MAYREANILVQTLGFGLGTALSTLLLVLVCRSGGTDRRPRFWFAAFLLVANSSGLIKNMVLLFVAQPGFTFESRMRALGFAAGALCPCSIIPIWRTGSTSALRRRASRWIFLYAIVSGGLLAALAITGAWAPSLVNTTVPPLHWLGNRDAVGNLTIYNGLLTLLVAGIFLLPGTWRGPTDQIAVALMVIGLVVSTGGAVLSTNSVASIARWAQVARFQGILLLVVGALFYFSHFRAADIFAKYALRLLLASALAFSGALLLKHWLPLALQSTPFPSAVATLMTVVVVILATVLYRFLEGWIDLLVERRVFGKREPRQVLQDFRRQLASLDSVVPLIDLMRSVAADALAIDAEDVIVEPDVADAPHSKFDVRVPVPSSGRSMQLVVTMGKNRRALLTSEIDFLNEIALHAGRRLDDLERERERIERVRTEGRLSNQLVEAELRALRSQINPHFLFNALNTIASLIPSEPEKAERITVRLSSIFRYVLTHTDRPFTALDEEIGFLRTLLEIEQIRFGERLSVVFRIDPLAEHACIPSLILQPLVENAIKHGIAPKIGKSRILVEAKRVGESLQINVEDDGVGLLQNSKQSATARLSRGMGIGLENVRDRLSALYGPAAKLTLSQGEHTGCRATIVIPRQGATDADSSIACG